MFTRPATVCGLGFFYHLRTIEKPLVFYLLVLDFVYHICLRALHEIFVFPQSPPERKNFLHDVPLRKQCKIVCGNPIQ